MIGVTIFCTAVILFLSYCYWRQTRSRTAILLNKFKHPKPFIPVLGFVPTLNRKPDVTFDAMREVISRFNETSAMWAGIHPTLNVVTPEDAEIILSSVKHIDKAFTYDMLHPWLGTGLLTSTGTKWHQRRKMLTPAFHYNILQIFVKTFGEQSEKLVEKLKVLCGEEKTNILPLISNTTLATICETSMGIKFNEKDSKTKVYYDSLYTFCEIVMERMFSPWLYSDMIYHLFPLSWKENKLIPLLHKYTESVIKSREEQFQDSDVTDLDTKSNETTSKKRLAMLDLLISAKKSRNEIDDEGIREEVDTFVFEGHDTTHVAITYSLLLLANHKHIQDKVIEELDEIFGDSKRHASYDDLQNMKYIECCIKESLRLYPSVPLIGREIKEDIQLTQHVAPADTNVYIHIYNIHRDPRHYPDPEKYDPNRFLPENSKGRHPYAYIPFSAGPRNCIGQKFAMLELKSVVSSILRNFTMEPVDAPKDLQFVTDLVLRIKGPMHIKFIPRT